mmetsp:Transcript_21602/g.47008  ORF Transcript_21602/g.47008 Transcript_21602/m.47008 type:complete len:86 (+) Transcript_21602:252-509(+)
MQSCWMKNIHLQNAKDGKVVLEVRAVSFAIFRIDSIRGKTTNLIFTKRRRLLCRESCRIEPRLAAAKVYDQPQSALENSYRRCAA